MNEIEDLRKKIDEIDESIIRLLFSRFQISSQIGKIKKERGLPITNEEREIIVREKWLQKAKQLGFPEPFIDSILNLLFSYSKTFQIYPKEKRRVVVIGYGGMAKSLSSLLSLAKQEVVITGRDKDKAERLVNEFNLVYMDPQNAINWGDFIIFTLPPNAIFSDFSNKLMSYAKGKIISDISSTKSGTFGRIEEQSIKYGFSYVSLHPLFGPYLFPVGEKVVIIPSRTSSNECISKVESFVEDLGLVPVRSTVDEHDKAMAVAQVLPHFYLLALSLGIEKLSKELGIDYEKFKTTNFKEVLRLIERLNSIKGVVLEIQKTNPYSQMARDTGLVELNNLFSELKGDKNDSIRGKG
ncbi:MULTISPECIES: chorismate mutase [Acidianus]|uniref:Chorismate mutase n=1 Tax=Candidatus Acidianus copahuensis TaxID=1160895 RepID=A0A031LRD1_9CREN|nr:MULTISPECIES: chorismate mutase [Acidianus]EZQ06959.1 chorismate mutase [Candidatus Acidianus copahuensis]NON62347.1 chorismate mutase [Acidianus sp. RZ1]